jgi:hypothetical protein
MTRRIKVSIKARGESDFPTVDDFLDQVRDYFEILGGVEQALAEDGMNAIEWRIVGATTNSPIALAFVRPPSRPEARYVGINRIAAFAFVGKHRRSQ